MALFVDPIELEDGIRVRRGVLVVGVFSMALIRTSTFATAGLSRVMGGVSRGLFRPLVRLAPIF